MSKSENAQTTADLPEHRDYRDGAHDGVLVIGQCLACQKPHFYPRPICPLCGSSDTKPLTTSGRGTVYSFSIVRNARQPTASAIVELAEGPRVTTIIADADVYELRIGDEVEVAFNKTDDGEPALAFTTAAAQRARAYSRQALAASAIVPGEPAETPIPDFVDASVIGAGTMGVGISLALLTAGIAVQLIDTDMAATERARNRIAATLAGNVSRGRITEQQSTVMLNSLRCSQHIGQIAASDLVIEAVWEQLGLKKKIFAEIDKYARTDALLGTNTSTLDIDQIADATERPASVVGLHFFSPAHIMKLLEVVRGPRTNRMTILRAMALGKRLGKTAVLVGTCDGFVGNRLMIARERQAGQLLLEGSSPQQVDQVIREFGLPMGTFELQDMAGGIELNYRHRQETGAEDWLIDRLFERGRLGLKTGKGYYRYDSENKKPYVDNEVLQLINEASKYNGINRRAISDQEVRDRLIFPMINEAAKLIEEGIVSHPSDIDVVWQKGYGWPTWKGGPVYWADQIGPGRIRDRLRELASQHGAVFAPARLLERLADTGGCLLINGPSG